MVTPRRPPPARSAWRCSPTTGPQERSCPGTARPSRGERPGGGRPAAAPARCDVLVTVSDDDPVTGRRMLTGSAYADDRHLRSRMAIYAFAETSSEPRWRTSVIPWDGTQ